MNPSNTIKKRIVQISNPYGEETSRYMKEIIDYQQTVDNTVEVIVSGDAGAMSTLTKRTEDLNPKIKFAARGPEVKQYDMLTPTQFAYTNGKIYTLENPIGEAFAKHLDPYVTVQVGTDVQTVNIVHAAKITVAPSPNQEDVAWIYHTMMTSNPGAVDMESSYYAKTIIDAKSAGITKLPKFSPFLNTMDDVGVGGQSIVEQGHGYFAKSKKTDMIFQYIIGNFEDGGLNNMAFSKPVLTATP